MRGNIEVILQNYYYSVTNNKELSQELTMRVLRGLDSYELVPFKELPKSVRSLVGGLVEMNLRRLDDELMPVSAASIGTSVHTAVNGNIPKRFRWLHRKHYNTPYAHAEFIATMKALERDDPPDKMVIIRNTGNSPSRPCRRCMSFLDNYLSGVKLYYPITDYWWVIECR